MTVLHGTAWNVKSACVVFKICSKTAVQLGGNHPHYTPSDTIQTQSAIECAKITPERHSVSSVRMRSEPQARTRRRPRGRASYGLGFSERFGARLGPSDRSSALSVFKTEVIRLRPTETRVAWEPRTIRMVDVKYAPGWSMPPGAATARTWLAVL